jgi:hypothetical protein
VFCYPNGRPADYSAATIAMVRDAGFIAAVTTEQQHVSPLSSHVENRYRLPRFSCPNDVPHLAQVVSGIVAAYRNLRGLQGS